MALLSIIRNILNVTVHTDSSHCEEQYGNQDLSDRTNIHILTQSCRNNADILQH